MSEVGPSENACVMVNYRRLKDEELTVDQKKARAKMQRLQTQYRKRRRIQRIVIDLISEEDEGEEERKEPVAEEPVVEAPMVEEKKEVPPVAEEPVVEAPMVEEEQEEEEKEEQPPVAGEPLRIVIDFSKRPNEQYVQLRKRYKNRV